MIVYSETKKRFIEQCRADSDGTTIGTKVADAMIMAGIRFFDEAQKRAWRNSLPPVAEVLEKTKLSDDAIVAVEYTIRQAKERLDFVITGKDASGNRSVIVVELKQWSTVQKSAKDDFVFVNVAHGHMEDHWHPSYQALNYSNIISNTYEIFQTEIIKMYACSFLHYMPSQYASIMKDTVAFPKLTDAP